MSALSTKAKSIAPVMLDVVNINTLGYLQSNQSPLTPIQFFVCDSYIRLVCIMYPEVAVATVIEIATFPLAKVLHSRSIENVFFSF